MSYEVPTPFSRRMIASSPGELFLSASGSWNPRVDVHCIHNYALNGLQMRRGRWSVRWGAAQSARTRRMPAINMMIL